MPQSDGVMSISETIWTTSSASQRRLSAGGDEMKLKRLIILSWLIFKKMRKNVTLLRVATRDFYGHHEAKSKKSRASGSAIKGCGHLGSGVCAWWRCGGR